VTPDALSGWIQRVFGNPRPKPSRPHEARERATPLTRDRIATYLLSRGYRFLLDDDGDLTGTWDGSRFWFLLLGERAEILQVRGRWHRTLPTTRRTARRSSRVSRPPGSGVPVPGAMLGFMTSMSTER